MARKTVNLEQDVLRQLLDLCVRHRWRSDNPARMVKKLPWKLSRLPQALTYGQVQEALRLAAEVPPLLKALNPALSLHSLRHTFATWRLEMRDPMIRIQSLMGHSSVETLLHYAHVEPDPMQDLLPLLGPSGDREAGEAAIP